MGPRDPSTNHPFNLLDLAATAWAPPNLPLFPGAPAPTGAPVAVSAPAADAPPWLRPLHELQQTALSRNPFDTASSGETPASRWTSSDWVATPRIPAAAPPYVARAASNPYVGSAAAAGELDPARTRRLLAEAKRAYDFAAWISGGPDVRPPQPMQYAAAAADVSRPGAPSAGIDQQFDGVVGLRPSQDQLGPTSNGLFVRSSSWPLPRASMDAALPPMVLAASDQASPNIGDQNEGATIPSPWPDSIFWPGSPSAMKAGRNFIRNVQDLIDGWVNWSKLTEEEKKACYKQHEYDEKLCYENHSYNPDALRGCLQRAKVILVYA